MTYNNGGCFVSMPLPGVTVMTSKDDKYNSYLFFKSSWPWDYIQCLKFVNSTSCYCYVIHPFVDILFNSASYLLIWLHTFLSFYVPLFFSGTVQFEFSAVGKGGVTGPVWPHVSIILVFRHLIQLGSTKCTTKSKMVKWVVCWVMFE
jgi:hypothetical protein